MQVKVLIGYEKGRCPSAVLIREQLIRETYNMSSTDYCTVAGRLLKTTETIEFMFAGINMFWARLRLILARSARLWRAVRK